MNNYTITKTVSKFGMVAGYILVALSTIGGLVAGGIQGGVVSLLVSGVAMVPFLMFCEGMHALVTIATNTAKDHRDQSHQKSA